MLNDNQPSSVTEVENENRRLRASLQKCESIVADCRAKLMEQMNASAPQNEGARNSSRGARNAR